MATKRFPQDYDVKAIPAVGDQILIHNSVSGKTEVATIGSLPGGGGSGTPGADGKTVLSGSGVPAAGLGTNGDFYINTAANTIHGPKAGGVWPSAVSLVGPQGPAGATGATGATGPAGADGSSDITPKWVNLTADYTLTLADKGKQFINQTATDYEITVPANSSVNFAEDFAFTCIPLSTGKIKVKGASGVTFTPVQTLTIDRPFTVMRYGVDNYFSIGVKEVYSPVFPMPVYEDNGGYTFVETASLASNSLDVNVPTTVNENDILIVQLFKDETVTFTVPSGWNLISQSSSSPYSQAAMWRRADGTEDGTTVNFTNSGTVGTFFSGVMHRISGAATTGTPYESLATQDAAFQQNPTHNIEAMTSTGVNRLALGLVYIGDNRTILTDALDYTNVYSQLATAGDDFWFRVYTYAMPTASTVAQQTIDFDQNEGGGTINLLMLPNN